MKKNKISVIMVTYAHEKYIRESIEGVLMQEGDFEVELIIGNDCSPDNTDEIICDILATHPRAERIRYYNHEKNKGMMPNFIFILEKAEGEYIALCEGDDYWIDPYKLQKQLDFLRNNKDCVFCFHKTFKVSGTGEREEKNIYPKGIKKEILDEKEFFKIPTIPTASVLFSNQIKFPEIYHSHGDFVLYCTLLSLGKAGFINEAMSVYKLHEGGISSAYSSNPYMERRITELKVEGKYAGFSHSVRNEIHRILTEHIEYYLNKNRGKLSLPDKISYIRILLGQKAFYNLSFKKYMTLTKTLLK